MGTRALSAKRNLFLAGLDDTEIPMGQTHPLIPAPVPAVAPNRAWGGVLSPGLTQPAPADTAQA